MKLTLNNVAAIESAEIELNNITVIAGYNSTGKSTISKTLYGMISPYNNMYSKINFEKEKSLRFLLRDYENLTNEHIDIIIDILKNIKGTNTNFPKSISIDQFVHSLPYALKQFLEENFFFYDETDAESFKTELLFMKEDLCKLINPLLQKDDSEYIARIIQLTLSNIFNKQLLTLNNTSNSFLKLEINNNAILTVEANHNLHMHITNSISNLRYNILYLETKHIIDELNNNNRKFKNTSNPYENNLLNLLRAEPESDTELSAEEQTEYKNFLNTVYSIFNETLHGEVGVTGFDDGYLSLGSSHGSGEGVGLVATLHEEGGIVRVNLGNSSLGIAGERCDILLNERLEHCGIYITYEDEGPVSGVCGECVSDLDGLCE